MVNHLQRKVSQPMCMSQTCTAVLTHDVSKHTELKAGGDSLLRFLPDPNAVVSTPSVCTAMVCALPTVCDHVTVAEKLVRNHSCDRGPCPPDT